MDRIPDEASKLLDRMRLGYVATVSGDGTPNLSPKGTIFALDERHLVFADIRSPQTVSNVKINPAIEINVVDPISRRGYRFKGTATVLDGGGELADIVSAYKSRGVRSRINAVVKVQVDSVAEITSPLYDLGASESEIRKAWRQRLLDSS